MDKQQEQGFTTLVMVMGFGLAIGASVYGTHAMTQSNGKLQGDSQNRNASELRAMQLLDAAAQSLNNTYCGSANGICIQQNANTDDIVAIANHAALITDGNDSVTVTDNTFGTTNTMRVRATTTRNGASSTMDAYMLADDHGVIDAVVNDTVNNPADYMTIIKGNVDVSGSLSVVGFNSAAGVCTSTAATDSHSAVAATGNLTASGNASLPFGVAGGTITDGSGSKNRIINETANVTDIANFDIDINAYNMRGRANFVFTFNSAGTPQVSFDNRVDLPSGSTSLTWNAAISAYELTSAAGTVFSSVCSTGTCVTYAPSSKLWTVQNTPQSGVFFFDGHALWNADDAGKSDTVTYYNSVIATGDIDTAQSHITAYGNKPSLCSGAIRPGNVCDGTNASGAVADLLFLAGGVYPGTANGNTLGSIFGVSSGADTGGDIKLKTNSFFRGVILAHDDIDTQGNLTIAGKIMAQNARSVAAGTEGNSTDGKVWNGNVTICLDASMDDADSGGRGPGAGDVENTTQSVAYVFRPRWARHM